MRADTKVFIAFDLSVSGQGTFFTLNDAVKGELDSTTYVLAGDVLTNVTEDVRSVQVRRGRSWQLDKFETGTANIVLANRERQYDPSNAIETATRLNYVPNPSFEVDTTGWSASATDFTTAGASLGTTAVSAFGAAAALVTTGDTSASQGFHTILTGLPANTTLIVSGYVYPVSGAGVFLATKDTTNGVAGTVGLSASPSGLIPPAQATIADWERISSVITTGASVADVVVAFGADENPQRLTLDDPVLGQLGKATLAGGTSSQFRVDAVLCETGSTVLPYFDGGAADGTILSASTSWNGTPNNSTSNLVYGIPGTGSPYFPSVKPRKEMQITLDGGAVFTGLVEDWDYQFSLNNDSTATVRGADGFTRLAQTLINPLSVPAETSGERVERVLDLTEVGWPAGSRAIDTGAATLGAQDIGGTSDPQPVNTLQYLQQVESAEPGALFIDGAGVLRFRSRATAQTLTGVTFSDTGDIPFVDVSIDYGVDNVRNQVTINRVGGSLITVTSQPSVDEYGVIAYQLQDSLLSSDEQAETLATWIVQEYAEPKIRIDRITVDVGMLTISQRSEVFSLDLGDVVRVTFTPQGVGLPIDRYLTVDALEHSITPSDHRMTLDLSDASPGFVLDSPAFGVLNSSKLGF
jgi:hypothetical protein